MQEIVFVTKRLRGSYQLPPSESWKPWCPYLTWKCSFCLLSHYQLKSLIIFFIMPPDKHHMNHIPLKQYFMILPPPLQHVHTSYIISHKKVSVFLQQNWLSMASPLPPSLSQKTKSENLCISTREHSNLITLPPNSEWLKFRYLKTTTPCLCNCSPSSGISGSNIGTELSYYASSVSILYHLHHQ